MDQISEYVTQHLAWIAWAVVVVVCWKLIANRFGFSLASSTTTATGGNLGLGTLKGALKYIEDLPRGKLWTVGIVIILWVATMAVMYFSQPEWYSWWRHHAELFWQLPAILMLLTVALDSESTSKGLKRVGAFLIIAMIGFYDMGVMKAVKEILPPSKTPARAPTSIPQQPIVPAKVYLDIPPGETRYQEIFEGYAFEYACYSEGEILPPSPQSIAPCAPGVTGIQVVKPGSFQLGFRAPPAQSLRVRIEFRQL